MKIFVAGATGVVGRRLLRELSARGHEVTGLARSPAKAELVRSLGALPAGADLFDPRSLARAAAGAEVVIHAATAIPTGRNARFRGAWSTNDRIRRDGTRALTEAAGAVGAGRYLQQSVAWVVRRESGEGTFDEDTLPDPPQLIRSAVDGEGIARDAGERHGFTVGVLRGGWLYGPIPQTRMVVDLLRKRRLPVIGRGDFLVAPIHIDDLAAAFAVAAESDREGTWNVVDDEPLRFASLVRRVAELAGAPHPRTVPGWVARLLLGGPVYESMTTSMDTSNARIRAELGWAPAHPTLRQGLRRIAGL